MISKEDFVNNMLKINMTSDAIGEFSEVLGGWDVGSAPMFNWYNAAADLVFAIFNSENKIELEHEVESFYEDFWNIAACMTWQEAEHSDVWQSFYDKWSGKNEVPNLWE